MNGEAAQLLHQDHGCHLVQTVTLMQTAITADNDVNAQGLYNKTSNDGEEAVSMGKFDCFIRRHWLF